MSESPKNISARIPATGTRTQDWDSNPFDPATAGVTVSHTSNTNPPVNETCAVSIEMKYPDGKPVYENNQPLKVGHSNQYIPAGTSVQYKRADGKMPPIPSSKGTYQVEVGVFEYDPNKYPDTHGWAKTPLYWDLGAPFTVS